MSPPPWTPSGDPSTIAEKIPLVLRSLRETISQNVAAHTPFPEMGQGFLTRGRIKSCYYVEFRSTNIVSTLPGRPREIGELS